MDTAIPSRMRQPLFEGFIAVDADGDEEGGVFELDDILNLVLSQVYRVEDAVDRAELKYKLYLVYDANTLKLD